MDQMLEEMAFENDLRRCCLGQFVGCLYVLFLSVFGAVVTIWILQHP